MTLYSFFFLFLFLTFFLGIMERLLVKDMTIDKGGCVVAFGLRDLRLVMKPWLLYSWTTT